jgi:transposase-like protein
MAKKLTPEEWQEIIRLHLIDGIGVRALSKQFGVPSSTIQSRTKTAQIAQVKEVANQIVDVNHRFTDLDDFAQELTTSLACKLQNISDLAASVAESEAKSARKLSAIKSIQILNLNKENPDLQSVALIKVLGEAVNDSMKPAFNLMSANKEAIDRLNGPQDNSLLELLEEIEDELKDD